VYVRLPHGCSFLSTSSFSPVPTHFSKKEKVTTFYVFARRSPLDSQRHDPTTSLMNTTTVALTFGVSPQNLHSTIGGAFFGFTLGAMYVLSSFELRLIFTFDITDYSESH
jgi:hypothetical protein